MSSTENAPPAASGPPPRGVYRWPAEWEPHEATWVSWPHNRNSWPGKFEPVPEQFARFVRTLAEYEPVNVVASGEALAEARKHLGATDHVALWDAPTNDAWMRDHGPIFLQRTTEASRAPAALIDWRYNAWGGKYPPYNDDDAIPSRVARWLMRKRYRSELVIEGGAIEGNGAGLLMTTSSCLLHRSRNPQVSQESLEQVLREWLGVEKTLWLPRGELAGDDTDGHIDQLARFVGPQRVVAAVCHDASDENHAPLAENLEFLRRASNQHGQPLDVVPLPLPGPKHVDGQRLPASYCNFYIANGAVLVPTFRDGADAAAIEILRGCFPQRNVVGVDALDIVWGLGAWHCLTQQQPAEFIADHASR